MTRHHSDKAQEKSYQNYFVAKSQIVNQVLKDLKYKETYAKQELCKL